MSSSSIELSTESIAPQPGIHPWCWKIRIDNPRNVTPESLARIHAWCVCHAGAYGVDWNRKGVRFYFAFKQEAMLFKLTWHGVSI